MILGKTSFVEFNLELAHVLDRVTTLGLKWKNTRFDLYKQRWQEAAQLTYPRTVTRSEFEVERHFFEAASQCQQLVRSASIWDSLERSVLVDKLKKVLNGKELPPVENFDDEPRNTLLELMTATMLRRCGFDVQLTGDESDVVATYPGMPTFAVECKRPSSEKTIEKNLRRLRTQLAARCGDDAIVGMPVVGIDRISGLAGAFVKTESTELVEKIVVGKTRKWANTILDYSYKKRITLVPNSPVGAIVLVGTVYVGYEAMPYTVEQLTFFSMGQHPKTDALVRAMETTFKY